MRFNLRLHGVTASEQKCVMYLTVYASSRNELVKLAKEQSTEGPWYYTGSSEAVSESETITVEHLEDLSAKGRKK
jgi:hypothetical protein